MSSLMNGIELKTVFKGFQTSNTMIQHCFRNHQKSVNNIKRVPLKQGCGSKNGNKQYSWQSQSVGGELSRFWVLKGVIIKTNIA